MSWWIQSAIAGSTAFIATNVDDILILMLFFAQTNSSFRRQHIVVGQYLGFIASFN
jgi:cadmium resistance protein CadD (predicted permease)